MVVGCASVGSTGAHIDRSSPVPSAWLCVHAHVERRKQMLSAHQATRQYSKGSRNASCRDG
eukprot:6426276-Amphidinium_carterae.1